ncbi:MAG: PAS domain-containing protein [Kiritimatiellaeota bacterium]|nr:PAS domain-containing protein [Kiritimatiellota bacterium]
MSGTERILIKKSNEGPGLLPSDTPGVVPLVIASRPSPAVTVNVLEHLYDAVVLVNRLGIVQQANHRAAELFGYPQPELRGMAIGRLMDGITEGLLSLMEQKLQGGRCMVLEARCIRQNGSLFPAEVGVGSVALGDGPGLCFSLRNITQRREMQNQLRMAQNALQFAGCAVAMADLDSRLTYVNPAFCRMWRMGKPDSALGLGLAEIVGEANAGLLCACLSTQEPWSGELACELPGGIPLRLQVTSAPNFDHTDTLAGVVLSFLDITKRA